MPPKRVHPLRARFWAKTLRGLAPRRIGAESRCTQNDSTVYAFCQHRDARFDDTTQTTPFKNAARVLKGPMLPVLDRYILGQIALATGFVVVGLAGLVLLVQSLRLVELIVNAGASAGTFWALVALALPRFLETLLPLALALSAVFVYARMASDREIDVLRAAGARPIRLAAPALALAAIAAALIALMTLWATPASLRSMVAMHQALKTQLPALLFREGVFANPTKGLTVYMRARGRDGTMRGLLLHDTRDAKMGPYTIMARSGRMSPAAGGGYEVVVHDGARQAFDPATGTLHNLSFERYTIALPAPEDTAERWHDAAERSLPALLWPDADDTRAAEQRNLFALEAHRRAVQPLLAPALLAVALAILLGRPTGRDGPAGRATAAILAALALQGAVLGALNAAGASGGAGWGIALLWLIALGPGAWAVWSMTRGVRS